MHYGAKNCAFCRTILVVCYVILRKAFSDDLLYLQYTNAAFPAPILERTNAEHITCRRITASTTQIGTRRGEYGCKLIYAIAIWKQLGTKYDHKNLLSDCAFLENSRSDSLFYGQ